MVEVGWFFFATVIPAPLAVDTSLEFVLFVRSPLVVLGDGFSVRVALEPDVLFDLPPFPARQTTHHNRTHHIMYVSSQANVRVR